VQRHAAFALALAIAAIGASAAVAKHDQRHVHRSVRVKSAVEDEVGSTGALTGKVTITAVDPTNYRDGLLIYLRRGRCFKTYKAADAYVTNGGYSNQITSGPPVPRHGSMTYDFSTQGSYYTVVCAMIYYSPGGQNASGAPIGTTKPYVSYTYATGHARIKHGPPVSVTTAADH
jgi:hypothetical protein